MQFSFEKDQLEQSNNAEMPFEYQKKHHRIKNINQNLTGSF